MDINEIRQKYHEFKYEVVRVCPICHAEHLYSHMGVSIPPLNIYTPYIACAQCGAVFQAVVMTEESHKEYYDKWYHLLTFGEDKIPPQESARMKKRAEIQLKILKSKIGLPKSMLDFACGQGWMGKKVERTVKYKGVDSSEVARTNKVCKATIASSLAEVKDTFELILVSHILEHVRQPVEFLKSLKPYLQFGGTIMIDVPNRLTSPSAYGISHIYAFDGNFLEEVINRAGLKAYKVATHGANGDMEISMPFNLVAFCEVGKQVEIERGAEVK